MYNEAYVIRTPSCIDVKIHDVDLIDHFMIQGRHVEYRLTRWRGELLAMPDATLSDILDDDNGHILRLVIRTRSHVIEIVPGGTFYAAHKQLTEKE